jgi:DNA-3-methyladenine glycosylase
MAAFQAQEVSEEGPSLTATRAPAAPRPLSRRFFARPSPVLARDLLGRVLVRRLDGQVLSARIVETEAYQQDDPASHSFAGRTARNEVMFGPAGFLYVYFTYGMHFCMNVVTGRPGTGSAVLLRAAEPLTGEAVMVRRRGVSSKRLLCSGPARLTQAFGVTREQNGEDLVDGGELWIAAGRPMPDEAVAVGPRIGIRLAADVPWRFLVLGSPFVSRGGTAAPG